jgi:hypothetical protein
MVLRSLALISVRIRFFSAASVLAPASANFISAQAVSIFWKPGSSLGRTSSAIFPSAA